MSKKIVLASFVAATALPALGTAAEPTPEHTLTGNVGLYSQYVFRGLTQTDRDPAIQGGFDYAHSSGLYAGTWASNISWLRDGGAYRSGGSLEWDFYGGWKPTYGDFTFDIGTLYYWYPGNAAFAAPGAVSNPKADTWEVYGGVGWKWLSAKFSYSLMNKTFAVRDSSGTWYLDLTATVPLGERVTMVPPRRLILVANDPRLAQVIQGHIQKTVQLNAPVNHLKGLPVLPVKAAPTQALAK